ncbi:MAG: sigma-54-dependent transcriptional regulator [bacterium]
MIKPLVLIVDDDEDTQQLLCTRFSSLGYTPRSVSLAEEMRVALQEQEFQAVLLDLMLPDANGLDLLRELKQHTPDVPVIMITGHGDVTHAVDAMRLGAYDFCQKPIDLNRLSVSLKNALEQYTLKRQVFEFEKVHRRRLFDLVGSSPAMQVVYRTIDHVAPVNVPVLIIGESGTGKELVARAIHQSSPRHGRDMITVNCAAIPKDLLENELFGHEPNAFTGAGERFIGRCEQAHESTLFLDEIAEMDINLQAKLLRFLQDFTFYRVGGKQPIQVDVRILAATNQDPLQALKEGKLREDLYYRLNVVPIRIPPLREHPQDIPELAEHFLHKHMQELQNSFEGFTDTALDLLCNYSWQGNIRELENVIRQVIILNPGGVIDEKKLPEIIRAASTEHPAGTSHLSRRRQEKTHGIVPIEELERNEIEKALYLFRGNVAKASLALHLSQATLYRKLRDYGMTLERFKD